MKALMLLSLALAAYSVQAQETDAKASAAADDPQPQSDGSLKQDVPIPEKKLAPFTDESVPTVTIRTEANGDRVEEYRLNGQITMVRVMPERGPAYELVDQNGDGRLDRADAPAGIAPVYWTVYSWD